jgi:hypothetical protein
MLAPAPAFEWRPRLNTEVRNNRLRRGIYDTAERAMPQTFQETTLRESGGVVEAPARLDGVAVSRSEICDIRCSHPRRDEVALPRRKSNIACHYSR